MKFHLIDQILSTNTAPAEGEPATLTAVKALAASEDYLQDHFPTFPVMPGVLMVEAAVQSCRALAAELTSDPAEKAAASRLVLARARSLKFGSFVAPGDTLTIDVTTNPTDAKDFKATGHVSRPNGQTARAFSGRLTLRTPR